MLNKVIRGLAQTMTSVNLVIGLFLVAVHQTEAAIFQFVVAAATFYLGYIHEEQTEAGHSTNRPTEGD